MGSLFDLYEVRVLDNMFGTSASYTAQSPNLYIGLSKQTITEGASQILEPSGGSYARVAVSNNKTTWTNASAGSLSNAITITFPTATALWGDVLDFFLASVSGAGVSNDYIGYGTLTVSKTVQSGDTASFAIGALTITLT